jgi:UDP-N-acetylmuramyl pentapeptide phosphotransferase/UDP-N-acetylglucosamine-1-phosphate transferase
METLLLYSIILIIAFALGLAYKFFALRFNIVDQPNHRSLHIVPTIRGGGIIFPLLVIPALFIGKGEHSNALAFSLFFLGAISFWDDVNPRPPIQRFIIHIGIALYWVWLLDGSLPFWTLPLIVFLFIAFLNAYNFMDGVNGITVLYTAAIWCLLRITESPWLEAQWGELVVITVDIAILTFAFFNVRKRAIFFSGDVGAMTIACFIGVNLLLLIARDHSIYWLALVAVYGVDAGMTIIRRLLQGEKLWEAHRKHLFQQLVHYYGWGHLSVSFFYAAMQFLIGLFFILQAKRGCNYTVPSFIMLLAVMALLYYVVVKKANKGKFITEQPALK